MNNLYHIKDKAGRTVPFRLNWGQQELLDNLHTRVLILKCRQIGFSTLIQLLALDCCIWRPNYAAGVIADRERSAKAIFEDRIKFAYQQLPEGIRNWNGATNDSAQELRFENGSLIRVDQSLRSGTYQFIHVSEYGKICAKYPDKAREIRTGALETVAPGDDTLVAIESTAEGREGHFFDLCQSSRRTPVTTRLDWRFHFFPWWREPGYALTAVEAKKVSIPADSREYFDRLARDHDIRLSDEQCAWYVQKERDLGEDMKREYPSTPDEAFESSLEGAYFAAQMTPEWQETNVCRVPFVPHAPVNTFWDLGMDDSMTVLLHQRIGVENRFIGRIAGSGEGIPYYVREMEAWSKARGGVIWGQHYGPHDLNVRELLGEGETRAEAAKKLGISFTIVPRVQSKADSIEAARQVLPTCYFDQEECATLVKHLLNYRKDWNEQLGVWRNTPRHDAASHDADAFQCFAMGFRPAEEYEGDLYPEGVVTV